MYPNVGKTSRVREAGVSLQLYMRQTTALQCDVFFLSGIGRFRHSVVGVALAVALCGEELPMTHCGCGCTPVVECSHLPIPSATTQPSDTLRGTWYGAIKVIIKACLQLSLW